jgi:undecaprenyl-diphosphatase
LPAEIPPLPIEISHPRRQGRAGVLACAAVTAPPTIDVELLAVFNRPGLEWLDLVMKAASSRLVLLPLALLAALYLWRRSPHGLLAALLLGVAIAASDLVAVRLLKPAFARVRPCAAEPARVVAIAGCGSGASFPSSHATQAAAAAMVLGWGSPALAPAGAAIALLVGISRVYLGVHWPTDVAAGWALGAAIGALLIFLSRRRHALRAG